MAKALAAVLTAPPPPRLAEPTAGRPLGRTQPTALAAQRERKEVTVPGSTAAGCETYIVDEWLTLRWHAGGVDKAVPTGVRVVAAPLGESVIYQDASRAGPPALVVQVPLVRDESTVVDFKWPERARRLEVFWSTGIAIEFRARSRSRTRRR